MDGKFLNFILKIGVIVGAYLVASRYIGEQYVLAIAFGLILIYTLYYIFSKKDPMPELKRFGNTANYIKKTKRALIKDDLDYNVYMAYGLLYKGDIEESNEYLRKIDVNLLQDNEDLYHLYLQTIIRIEYKNENMIYLDEVFKLLLSNEVIHPNTIRIVKIMILNLEKRYEEVLDELLKTIPAEDRRHVIMELEIFLADVYLALNQTEDAKAVLEFVASKKFDTVHVEEAKTKLMNLS